MAGMNITPREADILKVLLRAQGPVSKQEISERLGVSKRTIQREFPDLEQQVRHFDLTLVQHKGSGVVIEGRPEDVERLSQFLSGTQEPDPGNPRDRRQFLIFSLLREGGPRKIYSYAQQLGVSESTISADLDAIVPWFAKSGLALIRRSGYGVALQGSEEALRTAMRRYIGERTGQKRALVAGRSEDALAQVLLDAEGAELFSLLDQETVRRVAGALERMNEPGLRHLTDTAYLGLVLHLAIGVERVRKGDVVQTPAGLALSLQSQEGYPLAQRIIEAIGQEFSLPIPEVEISYVLLHLAGSQVVYSKEEAGEPAVGEARLMEIADRMIDAYDPELSYDLHLDEEFLRGLMVHLRPAVIRLTNHFAIFNPILDDIRTEYPEVFEKCRRAAAVLGEEIGCEVSDEETGFLAMHFGAAQVRAQEQHRITRRVLVGVVCVNGFGVARLMMARLEATIGRRSTLRPYGMDEITPRVIAQTDFFISTIDLQEKGVDYVRVSPLVTERDLEQIRCKIEDYAHLRRPQTDETFTRQTDRAGQMSREIKSLIAHYQHFRVSEALSFSDLLRYLSLKVTATEQAAAVVRSRILQRESINTQIFPELGFALLHCRTQAVQEPLFVTCTTRDGSPFTNSYFKGIRAVVMELMPEDENRKIHEKLLGHVSGALARREDFRQQVLAGDEEGVRQMLSMELKSFFFDFLDSV